MQESKRTKEEPSCLLKLYPRVGGTFYWGPNKATHFKWLKMGDNGSKIWPNGHHFKKTVPQQ